jgi:cell division transport system permease protein
LAVCLGGLGGAALIGIGDALRGWDASLAGSVTLQVPAETSAARLKTVVALLRQTRGLTEVRLLEPEETARLVQPWLGASLTAGQLPVPQIVDMRMDGAGTPDFAELRQKLASIVPDARLEYGGQSLAGRRAEAHRLSGAIGAFIALAFLVSLSAAVSHARSALAVHRDELELLHLLGATDRQVVRRFAAAAMANALPGAGFGALAAALTLLVLGGAPATLYLSTPAGAAGIADWRVWLILAGAAIAGAVIPMAVARDMVRRRLAQMA